jgi:hypothetical protein
VPSIFLVRSFGLTGVALGALIALVVMSLGFFVPYIMRVMNVSAGELVMGALIPATVPIVPMSIVTSISKELRDMASLLSLVSVTVIAISIYLIMYLALGASNIERHALRRGSSQTLRLEEDFQPSNTGR